MMVTSDGLPDQRQEVDRQQVHRIHQEDPDEDGQGQPAAPPACGCWRCERCLNWSGDDFNQDFDGGENDQGRLTWRTSPRATAEAAQDTQQYAEEQRVEIDDGEIEMTFIDALWRASGGD